eukprot:762721-Amorphochlora_amoeboformis.AAC.1
MGASTGSPGSQETIRSRASVRLAATPLGTVTFTPLDAVFASEVATRAWTWASNAEVVSTAGSSPGIISVETPTRSSRVRSSALGSRARAREDRALAMTEEVRTPVVEVGERCGLRASRLETRAL